MYGIYLKIFVFPQLWKTLYCYCLIDHFFSFNFLCYFLTPVYSVSFFFLSRALVPILEFDGSVLWRPFLPNVCRFLLCAYLGFWETLLASRWFFFPYILNTCQEIEKGQDILLDWMCKSFTSGHGGLLFLLAFSSHLGPGLASLTQASIIIRTNTYSTHSLTQLGKGELRNQIT